MNNHNEFYFESFNKLIKNHTKENTMKNWAFILKYILEALMSLKWNT